MSNLFIAVLVIAAVVVLAWNFIPPVRKAMRGWTTMAEASIAAAMPFLGNAIDAFEQTDWKTYVPEHVWTYIIAGLAAWFIFKRMVTTTPPGSQS